MEGFNGFLGLGFASKVTHTLLGLIDECWWFCVQPERETFRHGSGLKEMPQLFFEQNIIELELS